MQMKNFIKLFAITATALTALSLPNLSSIEAKPNNVQVISQQYYDGKTTSGGAISITPKEDKDLLYSTTGLKIYKTDETYNPYSSFDCKMIINQNGILESKREFFLYDINKEYLGHIDTNISYRLPIGEYYIDFDSSSNFSVEEGCLSFKIDTGNCEVETNDLFDTANTINLNTLYSGIINEYGGANYTNVPSNFKHIDYDYYKFIINEPTEVYASVSTKSGYSINATIYKEDSYRNTEEILEINSENNSNSRKIRLSAGIYYIKFYSSYYEEYSFTINAKSNSDGTYELESNDDVADANFIEMDKSYTGNISDESDIDFYRLRVQDNGKAKIVFSIPRQTENKAYQVTLYCVDKDNLLEKVDSFYSTTNPTNFGKVVNISKGDYYIKIASGDTTPDSMIDYKISLQYLGEDSNSQSKPTKPSSSNTTDKKNTFYDTAYVGDEVSIDENDSYGEYTYTSSDDDIAEIDENGYVTFYESGKVTITQLDTSGKIVAIYEYTVLDEKNDDATITTVRSSKGSVKKAGRNGYTITLSKSQSSTTIKPKLSDKNATYTINGKKVKSINVSVAKGKSKTIKIKVTAEDGETTKVYTIKIKRKK